MKPSYLVKLNFLLLGLGLSLYVIYTLNRHGLPPALLKALGMNIVAKAEGQLNWCDSRVEALIRPDKFKLKQDGDFWQIEGSEAKVADFISVEKWFGRHCSVTAKKMGSVPIVNGAAVVPELFVKFINGQVEVLKRLASGVYEWKGQVFASPEMEEALKELEQLPTQEQPPRRPTGPNKR